MSVNQGVICFLGLEKKFLLWKNGYFIAPDGSKMWLRRNAENLFLRPQRQILA